jgi:hypothetical protein
MYRVASGRFIEFAGADAGFELMSQLGVARI